MKKKYIYYLLALFIIAGISIPIIRHSIVEARINEAETKIEQMKKVKNCEIYVDKHIAQVYVKLFEGTEFGYHEEKGKIEYIQDIVLKCDIPGVWGAVKVNVE